MARKVYTEEELLAPLDSTAPVSGTSQASLWAHLQATMNRLKTATGKASWADVPDATLAETRTHIDAVNPHSGSASSAHVTDIANPHAVTSSQAGAVPTTRLVNTTAPLTGGGALSVNRTLGISAATQSAAGSLSSSDKTKLDSLVAPQRVYVAPSFTTQTISVTTAGWQSTILAPVITVPALGAPPTGFKWLMDVVGGIFIKPPGAYYNVGLQTRFNNQTIGTIMETTSYIANINGAAIPLNRIAGTPFSTTNQFTVKFYFWVDANGSYEIIPNDFPVAKLYLVNV